MRQITITAHADLPIIDRTLSSLIIFTRFFNGVNFHRPKALRLLPDQPCH